MARDSEGRTRRDLVIVAAGPLAANAPRLSMIFDPVANVSYTLDHTAKTATKMGGNGIVFHTSSAAQGAGVRRRAPELRRRAPELRRRRLALRKSA